MRTIKASEVVKGMRVRVEFTYGEDDVQATWEGVVREPYEGTLCLGVSAAFYATPDHPVTVLAEPEPEWVEGAWYWVQYEGDLIPMRRLPDGWQTRKDATYPVFADFRRDVTVLGRVLIVDWPGDDVARNYLEWKDEDADSEYITVKAPALLAKAIRTQGGVR